MARLAESSVVIALRDFQWDVAISEERRPDLFLSLSGNTDQKLGDIKFGFDEKFMLFEAKSTQKEIKDEWDRAPKPRKHAYRKTREIIEGIAIQSEKYLDLFDKSLSAHFFVYHDYNAGNHLLAVEPYMTGIHSRHGFSEHPENSEPQFGPRTEDQIRDLLNGLKKVSLLELKDKRTKKTLGHASIEHIYNKEVEVERNTGFGLPLEPGLWLIDFQAYINYLCDGKDEEIESLIMTTSGKLIVFSGRTNNLKLLVDKFKNIEVSNDPEKNRKNNFANDSFS
ncbi:hypothetical protein [Xanthomonas arboricola]|uniref:hypothetical protein n=1 Tax=Xanthomonas arboricola TaxID=56448 RepID=UPI0011B0C2CF|nr:hypothetical protein [Xanthomonas arboricola]